MLARFDHHPMLTALLALSTAVLVVVVITLSTLLITLSPEATSNTNGGDNPGAAAAPPIWTPEAKTTDRTFNQNPLSPLSQTTP